MKMRETRNDMTNSNQPHAPRSFTTQSTHTKRPKAHLVTDEPPNDDSTDDFHQAARQRSERIFNETWNTKEKVRAARKVGNIPYTYTRIERAFTASAVSETTAEEIEKDEDRAKQAACALKSEMNSVDMIEHMQVQQAQIDDLTKELNNLRKERQSSVTSVTSHHSDPAGAPPTTISTQVNPIHCDLSYTMQTMLDKYDSLDDDSKNELFKYAISSGNENLQSRLLLLRQSKSGQSLAKLTKELIKLAESYKVPELKFDEQASK